MFRRMFPGFRVNVSNLLPHNKYFVSIEFISTDGYRYKYQDGVWIVSGKGNSQSRQNKFLYSNIPLSGKDIMKKPLSFNKVKLTNSTRNVTTNTVSRLLFTYGRE